MKIFRTSAAILLGAVAVASAQVPSTPLPYPPARTVPVVDTMYGVPVADPYRWLEDDRDAEVQRWVAAQGDLARRWLDAIPFRAAIRKRLGDLNDYTRRGGVTRVDGVVYYLENSGLQEHSVLKRRRKDGTVEVVLDPNTWSTDGTVSLRGWSVSDDGRWLAYERSEAGSDWVEIHFVELESMRLIADRLRWVKVSGLSWHGSDLYYSRYPEPGADASGLSEENVDHRMYRHTLMTPQENDVVVYAEPERRNAFHIGWVPQGTDVLVRSSRYGAERGSRLFVQDLRAERPTWTLLYEHAEADFNILDMRGDTVWAFTTEDAPRGKVIRMDGVRGKRTVVSLIPEGEHPITSVSVVGSTMFVTTMVDVLERVAAYTLDGRFLRTVDLPVPGSVSGFDGRRTDSVVFYTVTSYAWPATVYEYHLRTGTSTVWYQPAVGFDPSSVSVRQVFVRSADGTRIPMTLLSRRDRDSSVPAPTILYGYGGFNIAVQPAFSTTYAAWIEQGGVYAIANLRGGGEYGETWHLAGTKLRKQNVFDDAIACAEWLIANRITDKAHLAINGRSNGGLLVGALMTQRPDLFAAAVPEVGVLDMLRYHRFTIGWNWAADYGTVDDAAEFKALLAYSPLHRVETGVRYPATMVMTADHDDRVVPAHSFKFAAALQAKAAKDRPVLLRVETRSGHGAVNQSIALDGVADKFAFLWSVMGFRPDPTRGMAPRRP